MRTKLHIGITCLSIAAVVVATGGTGAAGSDVGAATTVTASSTTWSGYVIDAPGVGKVAGPFNSAFADFWIPTVVCGKRSSVVRIWDGLDGYGNTQLVRAGVQVSCVHSVPEYRAFYATSPAPHDVHLAQTSEMSVKAGDYFSITVTSAGNGRVEFDFFDEDSPTVYWNHTLAYRSALPLTTAECIVEAPQMQHGGTSVLAPFGVVTFQVCDSALSDQFGLHTVCDVPRAMFCPPNSVLTELTMVDGRDEAMATPGPSPDPSNAFQVVWNRPT